MKAKYCFIDNAEKTATFFHTYYTSYSYTQIIEMKSYIFSMKRMIVKSTKKYRKRANHIVLFGC